MAFGENEVGGLPPDMTLRFLDRMLSRSIETKAREAIDSMGRKCCVESKSEAEAPPGNRQVLWSGHLYDYSGYGKHNREILFRVANTFRVELRQDGIAPEPIVVDDYTRARLDMHKRIRVGPKAPLVRLYTPLEEKEKRYRINYTTMETQGVHPDFIARAGANYDELWTTTEWNREQFLSSGLKIPCYVMPEGVNPVIYRPMKRGEFPGCELLSTEKARRVEIPQGFVFLSVFQPTFRKGADVLVRAFEEAFAGDPDAALVLAGTTSPTEMLHNCNLWSDGISPEKRKTRVYSLQGKFTEEDMAYIFNAANAYVCCSRGEGWNLPAAESMGCGLPLIAPRAFAHLQYMNDWNSYLFDPDGYEPYPGASGICRWYDGMKLAAYGDKARAALVDLMRQVKNEYGKAQERGRIASRFIHEKYTWDLAADRVARRLCEIVGA